MYYLILMMLLIGFPLGINCSPSQVLPGDPSRNPDCCLEAVEVNIFVHRVQGDNGEYPAISEELALGCIDVLNEDFSETPIMFTLLGHDVVTGSEYIDTYNYYDELVAVNPNSDAIDIYFLPAGVLGESQGETRGAPPQIYTVIEGDLAGSHIVTHEIGHCLGLHHTFRGFHPHGACEEDDDAVGLPEYQSWENGDLVADTNPEQCFQNQAYTGDCVPTLDPGVPHTTWGNFMSYTPYECMYFFTEDQIQRMLLFLSVDWAIEDDTKAEIDEVSTPFPKLYIANKSKEVDGTERLLPGTLTLFDLMSATQLDMNASRSIHVAPLSYQVATDNHFIFDQSIPETLYHYTWNDDRSDIQVSY